MLALASSSKVSLPTKATSILSLSKKISESDRTVRSKMVVANIDGEEKVGERIWEQDGYFGSINPDFSIHKKNFPENAVVYINQAYLTVNDRDVMIYCDYAILGQIVVFRSPPENIDDAIKNDKKLVKIYIYTYIYNL